MTEPLISVIIPFYNGEKFITETVGSILEQGYPNLEIIVVDDGSRQESSQYLENLKNKITIISQENKGVASARNTGLKIARGEIIALIDQDDLWPKNRLANTLPHILDGSYDFVRGQTQIFFSNSTEAPDPYFQETLIGAGLYRRQVIDTVGFFDETMREGDDFDWNIRLSESSLREKRLAITTLLCRKHENNFSSEKDYIKKGQLASLKKKIERAKTRNTSYDL